MKNYSKPDYIARTLACLFELQWWSKASLSLAHALGPISYQRTQKHTNSLASQ